jgi:predicted ATPase/DNA-binding winged helix-turn-helix (wHTH) protein
MSASGGVGHYGYRFGEFRLYPAQRLLLRGDKKVDVGQTALSFIAFLVANAGRKLSRKELEAGVWGKATGDTTVATYVGTVRELFGEDSLIVLPTQGYQFTLLTSPLLEPPPEPQKIKSGSAPTQGTRPALRIGRKVELAQAATDLAQNRMVTIVGAGGVGKTWLAAELGWRVRDRFPKGVHFIDLSPIKDEAGVASATAKTMGVVLRGTKPPAEVIAGSLSGQKPSLLIFDGCEYVVRPAGAFILALLRAAPLLSVLATSQQPFNIPDEAILRLEPLPISAAVELFVKRVQAAYRGFKPAGDNAASVEEICRRLDGSPLALDLAARQVRSLGLEAVREGLKGSARFSLLEGGSLDAAARQQALRATVEWSHGLLDSFDQRVFRRLARFAGSFSREAAIAVAAEDGATEWDIVHALGRLADKSLLQFENVEPARYRFLETLQHFAAMKLEESGETDLIAERHLSYFRSLFEPADDAWETIPDAAWVKRFGFEIDNIRAALDWAMAKPDCARLGVGLCGATGRIWYMLDLVPEGRRYCDQFVEMIADDSPKADVARLLKYDGNLWRYADRNRAVALLERSASVYDQIGSLPDLGTVLSALGQNYRYLGRNEDAKTVLKKARRLLQGGKRLKSLMATTNELGSLAFALNDLDGAQLLYVSARDLARQLDDPVRENIYIFNLAEAEFRAGAVDRAILRAEEAAQGMRAAGLKSYLPWPLTNLAAYLALNGRVAEARPPAEEALPLLIEQGGHWLRLGLQGWALIAAMEGNYTEAAQLEGFADAEYRRAKEIREPTEERISAQVREILGKKLRSDDLRIWLEEGERLNQVRASELVRSRIASSAIGQTR